ncbi:MAG: polysaccharide biosynthesis/export family protein [Planctomycetes bacterium]|nr:polysaccharide biosynthesis/export family protein [Planctomycetota bacterium]
MFYLKYLFGITLFAVLLAGCETGPAAYPPNVRPQAYSPEEVKQRIEYKISANDVIEVFVWKNEDLSRDVTVRPDGKISLPLIGETLAEGKTLEELDDELTRKYAEYLVSPDISLVVKKFAEEKVFALGEVSRPGVYTISGTLSLVDLVSQAGGWTKAAKISNVFIIRGTVAKEPDVILVNMKEIMRGNTRGNVVLYPKDIVYIPSTVISDVGKFISEYIGPIYTTATTVIAVDYFKRR